MRIAEETIGDVLVEIVNVNRPSIREAEKLKEMVSIRIKNGSNKIVVDLSACEFIDSTFLGVLVSSLRKVNKLDGDLRLVGFKPAVKAMFELTRLFRVFETYSDLNDAVGSFNK
ncbi:STAS domain-containing protein [Bacteroidota bacterium]